MQISSGEYQTLLRRYLLGRSGAAALMAALLLAGIGVQLAAPQIVRRFIDMAQAGSPLSLLVSAALAYIGATVAHQALNTAARYSSERVAWDATNDLRADIADHVLHLDLGFHSGRTAGELIERIDGDVNALAGFFSAFTVELVGSALLLIGIVGAVALLDWRLGLAFALLAVLMPLVLTRLRRRGVPHWEASREYSARYFGFIGEVLDAREDLRSSGAEDYTLQRLLEYLRAWFPAMRAAELWSMIVWIAAVVLFALADALAYGLGGSLFRDGAISLGTLYMLTAYTAMLAAPLETLRSQLQDLQKADAAIARIRDVLNTPSQLRDGDTALPDGPLAVQFDRVSFGYRGDAQDDDRPVALDDLSFDIDAGRVLGLLGRSGSGKSTLARLLFRFYDPDRGSVRLGGVDLRQCALDSVRSRVGLVTQHVQLFHASLRDNLTFFAPDTDDTRLAAILGDLGLGAWLARQPRGLDTPINPDQLSTGEAQLLALARVFLGDPGLVILDEPSARIDPATEALLEHAIERLLKGRTAIIIAHRLATVARVDDILVLEGGRIAEYGRRAELLADRASRYARLLEYERLGDTSVVLEIAGEIK